MSAVKHVTDATFKEEVLSSDKPVLVDFWADWCGPCKQMAPVLDKLADEYGDKIEVVKLNTDQNPETPRSYNVLSLPTMNLYKDGEVVKQIIGAKPKRVLEKELAEFL
ncbi:MULTISPECIES: thioredoxin [Nocardiopsis]|uniref:Thioredoxin n=1 Tax=Nocardiopsis dassonvillei (strain ATCC 23218 / DSM 43111 / CIP 107115 / JCM 7437 / KCTC 9190 / NBRC 14626 / NCTC 10488 / NRRL B-5397 / IMRU 509) TaxID=446468 RepID=D7B149_NOCDD|nr:thioredoxin [Nocardiopsis dassonvillei]ADH70243.1 thioredoxin [Nocardiopsis dassonvillei subsp. dassonvillei DSM 43111]APC38204.1 thioredoxin [Nocardiopsis dassonvillei]NKY81424.1 thioredoxin [Nocardiopsis dassonvillei]VEI90762.1 Thioredoxin [Nocardiopsis dassonvillei]